MESAPLALKCWDITNYQEKILQPSRQKFQCKRKPSKVSFKAASQNFIVSENFSDLWRIKKTANPSFLEFSIYNKKIKPVFSPTTDWRFWWEHPEQHSMLNGMDSWLSASPVVCVLAQQCLYSRWHNAAPGPNTRSQALEFLQTPLIPILLLPKTWDRMKKVRISSLSLDSFKISQQVCHGWWVEDKVTWKSKKLNEIYIHLPRWQRWHL